MQHSFLAHGGKGILPGKTDSASSIVISLLTTTSFTGWLGNFRPGRRKRCSKKTNNKKNTFNLWNNQHRSCNPFLIMCQWILIYPDGDEMTNWILTGPLLWLCTVKSGQKSRSAMARSSDSANGRAPSSSSSSSVWKGRTYCWHLIRSRQWTPFIVYRSLKEMV